MGGNFHLKLQEAFNEIAALKKAKAQTDQEMAADYQSLAEQLNFKHIELESLKKNYAQTHQQLQAQITQLQSEINEVRIAREDTHRMASSCNENLLNKASELDMSSQYATTELRRIRVDHDQAIANLADNMNRWNETIRDLSREFHEFQKLMTTNQTKLQGSLESVQKNLVPLNTAVTQTQQVVAAQQQASIQAHQQAQAQHHQSVVPSQSLTSSVQVGSRLTRPTLQPMFTVHRV